MTTVTIPRRDRGPGAKGRARVDQGSGDRRRAAASLYAAAIAVRAVLHLLQRRCAMPWIVAPVYPAGRSSRSPASIATCSLPGLRARGIAKCHPSAPDGPEKRWQALVKGFAKTGDIRGAVSGAGSDHAVGIRAAELSCRGGGVSFPDLGPGAETASLPKTRRAIARKPAARRSDVVSRWRTGAGSVRRRGGRGRSRLCARWIAG